MPSQRYLGFLSTKNVNFIQQINIFQSRRHLYTYRPKAIEGLHRGKDASSSKNLSSVTIFQSGSDGYDSGKNIEKQEIGKVFGTHSNPIAVNSFLFKDDGNKDFLKGIGTNKLNTISSKEETINKQPFLDRRKKHQLGISFSPAGLLFPYHLGVASRLIEIGVLDTSVPLYGASAGAIIAVIIGLGFEPAGTLDIMLEIIRDCRVNGTLFRLNDLLRSKLQQVLPENAHTILNEREGKVGIAITPLRNELPLRGEYVTQFKSKDDLIDCMLASCCVPYWFAGTFSVECRGEPAIDGFCASPLSRFGCPIIKNVEHTVLVSPFPASSLLKIANDPDSSCITPEVINRVNDGSIQARFNRLKSSLKLYFGTDKDKYEKYTNIVRGYISKNKKLQEKNMAIEMNKLTTLFNHALNAQRDEILLQYFEQGRRDAIRWDDSWDHENQKKQ